MSSLTPFLVPILVPLIISWISKKYPYSSSRWRSSIELTDLYRKADRDVRIWSPIILIVTCYLTTTGLYAINHLFIEKDKLIVFEVRPDHFWWIGFGMIFSFGFITAYGMMIVYSIVLKDNLDAFIDYNNIRSGYDSIKVLKHMGIFFIVFGVLGYCLLWNYSVKIYKDKMMIRWFLSLDDKRYNYDQVKTIYYIKETAPHFDIIFKDDMDWNSQTGLKPYESQSEIVKFISGKSGVKIDTLEEDPKH